MKPDVVLTSLELAVSDAASLKAISWQVLVMDGRNCQRSMLSKAHNALVELDARHRLLLPHGAPLQVRARPSPYLVAGMRSWTGSVKVRSAAVCQCLLLHWPALPPRLWAGKCTAA